MEERLQKVIAKAGVASRRKAEELIQAGKVRVNGKVVTEMGVRVSPEDEITVNGTPLQQENKVYYLLNKPRRTICSVSDEKGRDTVLSCFEGINERIYPVGRLDYDTSGLLILTNDGEFANLMMHPRYHLPKTYNVTLSGVLTDDMARILSNGIVIEGKKTLPCDVEILERSVNRNRTVLNITIYEGRNREIRKMMEYFHCEVTRLERTHYGFLDLGRLRQGEYRKLRMFEVRRLKEMVSHESPSAKI
ncbi:MAG: pseudouridine synthase [Erysipelotrichaceae bacterium]|jgi:23S rRNA pseudouridine2605 synthase|nr:pseudouridine synthase [Erysipelotrichaceae bacterium]